ncbi:Uncharacterized protein QTN25_004574 [Entamoeba marina]
MTLLVLVLLSLVSAENLAYLSYSTSGNIYYASPLDKCLTFHPLYSTGHYYYVMFQETAPYVTYYTNDTCTESSDSNVYSGEWTIVDDLKVDHLLSITTPNDNSVTLYFTGDCDYMNNVGYVNAYVNDKDDFVFAEYSNDKCSEDDDKIFTQKFDCRDSEDDDETTLVGEVGDIIISCGASWIAILFGLLVLVLV